MLAASDPPTHAGLLAHDLGQQSEGIASAREVVPVATMVAENVIAFAEVLHDSYRVSLLAYVCVSCPAEQPFLEQAEHCFLEPPDKTHPAIKPNVTRLLWSTHGPGIEADGALEPDRHGGVTKSGISLPATAHERSARGREYRLGRPFGVGQHDARALLQ